MNPHSFRNIRPGKIAVAMALAMISLYRYAISPMLGPRCRFFPTCSEYAQEALQKHGAYVGTVMASRRLCRCHPWHAGGYDPVP